MWERKHTAAEIRSTSMTAEVSRAQCISELHACAMLIGIMDWAESLGGCRQISDSTDMRRLVHTMRVRGLDRLVQTGWSRPLGPSPPVRGDEDPSIPRHGEHRVAARAS